MMHISSNILMYDSYFALYITLFLRIVVYTFSFFSPLVLVLLYLLAFYIPLIITLDNFLLFYSQYEFLFSHMFTPFVTPHSFWHLHVSI